MFRNLIKSFNQRPLVYLSKVDLSSQSSAIKRFYKNVNIVKSSPDRYEIILDQRKLKTPKGDIFYTRNESLASMIAAEWDLQKDTIQLNQMHLTTLTNTVIDNPGNLDKDLTTEKLISFIESDTLCYRINEPEDLLNYQKQNWDPIIQWFADCFQCNVHVTDDVLVPSVEPKTTDTLNRYFKSFNFWSLTGLLYATENLKSIILACALINRQLSVKDSIKLSRIEEDFQAKRWGTVEFHHDLDSYNLETRVAAAVVFTLLNCEKSNISHKSL